MRLLIDGLVNCATAEKTLWWIHSCESIQDIAIVWNCQFLGSVWHVQSLHFEVSSCQLTSSNQIFLFFLNFQPLCWRTLWWFLTFLILSAAYRRVWQKQTLSTAQCNSLLSHYFFKTKSVQLNAPQCSIGHCKRSTLSVELKKVVNWAINVL